MLLMSLLFLLSHIVWGYDPWRYDYKGDKIGYPGMKEQKDGRNLALWEFVLVRLVS